MGLIGQFLCPFLLGNELLCKTISSFDSSKSFFDRIALDCLNTHTFYSYHLLCYSIRILFPNYYELVLIHINAFNNSIIIKSVERRSQYPQWIRWQAALQFQQEALLAAENGELRILHQTRSRRSQRSLYPMPAYFQANQQAVYQSRKQQGRASQVKNPLSFSCFWKANFSVIIIIHREFLHSFFLSLAF